MLNFTIPVYIFISLYLFISRTSLCVCASKTTNISYSELKLCLRLCLWRAAENVLHFVLVYMVIKLFCACQIIVWIISTKLYNLTAGTCLFCFKIILKIHHTHRTSHLAHPFGVGLPVCGCMQWVSFESVRTNRCTFLCLFVYCVYYQNEFILL